MAFCRVGRCQSGFDAKSFVNKLLLVTLECLPTDCRAEVFHVGYGNFAVLQYFADICIVFQNSFLSPLLQERSVLSKWGRKSV